MAWEEVNLSEVKTTLEPVAEGDYTLQLLGAQYDERDPNKVAVTGFIVNDGEFTGRRLFFSFPDPKEHEWSPRIFKRMSEAIGMDIEEGEDPVAYVTRVAEQGARVGYHVTVREYTPQGSDTPVKRNNVNIFNPKVAA